MNMHRPFSGTYSGFSRLQLIRCREGVMVIGWDAYQTEYSMMFIHRTRAMEPLRPLSQLITEMGPFPTFADCRRLITERDLQERESLPALALIGFYCFHQGYYMVYVTDSTIVAKIGKHEVHQITATEVMPLFEIRNDENKKKEGQYCDMLKQFKMDKFYFSASYDLSNPLGKNIVRSSKKQLGIVVEEEGGLCEVFQYNHEAMREFDGVVRCKRWIVSLVHGYCRQINTKSQGSFFNVIILARRSRHHAGARYLKRGLSPDGYPANHVQIEQIVVNHSAAVHCSSYLQVRASVPTYWVQRPSIAIPKPAIQTKQNDYLYLGTILYYTQVPYYTIHRYHTILYIGTIMYYTQVPYYTIHRYYNVLQIGTRKHFSDLIRRHGPTIYCVNLMRMKEKTARQSNLSEQFSKALSFMNNHDIPAAHTIHYIPLDMKYFLKLDKKLFVEKAKTLAYYTFPHTGIFLHDAQTGQLEMQGGVIRTNCVDCLDRTNSFQQLIGQTALAYQIKRLLNMDIEYEGMLLQRSLESEYGQLYEQMGDLLSIQYGSSLAHKQKIQQSTESRFQFFTAITRHVNNNFKDEDRQKQIDLFLGFNPKQHTIPLWDIKPCIDHSPSPSLTIYDTTQWHTQAHSAFLKCTYTHELKALFKEQQPTPLVRVMEKKHLLDNFVGEIVSNIVNEKQGDSVLRVTVKIKESMQEHSGVYPKEIKSLKEEVEFCYNIHDFYEESKITVPTNSVLSHIPVVNQKAYYIPQDNDLFMDSIDEYLRTEILDDEEIKKMERYLVGDISQSDGVEEDDAIEEEVLDQELMYTETLLKSRKLIGVTEEETEVMNFGSLGKINQREKRWVLKDNKVRVIQNILLKNFSQGNVKKIQQL